MKKMINSYKGFLTNIKRNQLNDAGLLIVRVSIGLMMALGHGWGKVGQILSGEPIQFVDPIGIGVTLSIYLVAFAEFICGLLVVLGLATRLATIPLIINMSVAAFVVHAADPWSRQEFALLYLIPFLLLFFTGAGRYSLDQKFLQTS